MIALEVYKKKKLLSTLLLTICICKAVCHVQIWTIHVFNERKYKAYYTSVHLIDYLFANKTHKKRRKALSINNSQLKHMFGMYSRFGNKDGQTGKKKLCI